MIKFLGVTGIITTSLTLSLLSAPPANAVECFLPNCYAAITVTGADAKHHIWAYRAFNYPSSKAALDASLTGCFKLPNGLYCSLIAEKAGLGCVAVANDRTTGEGPTEDVAFQNATRNGGTPWLAACNTGGPAEG
ncbi:hypothetical protein [Mycobacterium malmoense]|uniref:hypothetical protein n=1 Tax=Mycobacterium malmoense TaxID=1780 RepID=UPI001146C400|nr:hypothetical protein [Mycobacterium malmoense]